MEQESDMRVEGLVAARADTVNVNVWLRFADVACRITHPERALVVVNGVTAVVAPFGIGTEPPIAKAVFVDLSLILVVELEAVPRERTHVPEAPGVRLAGVHEIESGFVVSGTSEMDAVSWVEPLLEVMVALSAEVMFPLIASKSAEVLFARTVTLGGTVNTDGALLERETATPPASAAVERTTEHFVLELDFRLAETHRMVEMFAGASREIEVVLAEPFKVAVSVTDWFVVSVPAAAVNVAEVALAAILTEEGTVNNVGALLVITTAVALATGFDRVTVHVVLALETRLPAAH